VENEEENGKGVLWNFVAIILLGLALVLYSINDSSEFIREHGLLFWMLMSILLFSVIVVDLYRVIKYIKVHFKKTTPEHKKIIKESEEFIRGKNK